MDVNSGMRPGVVALKISVLNCHRVFSGSAIRDSRWTPFPARGENSPVMPEPRVTVELVWPIQSNGSGSSGTGTSRLSIHAR